MLKHTRISKVICILMSFLIIISSFSLSNSYAVRENKSIQTPLNLLKEVEKSQLLVDEEFTINYKIQPDPIPIDNIFPEKYLADKEIVLVIDSSESMNLGLDGNKRVSKDNKRVTMVKEAAKLFIDKFSDLDNVRIGLVDYDKAAKVKEIDRNELVNNEKFAKLKRSIDKGFKPNGSTNIGDGLRRAFWILKNSRNEEAKKYIILLTDGEPTALSVDRIKLREEERWVGGKWKCGDKDYPIFKLDDGAVKGNEIWDYKYNDPEGYALEYAKTVASQKIAMGKPYIDTFVIGFTDDINRDKLEEIAESSNGFYKEAKTKEDILEVYKKLADEIRSDLPIHGVRFKEVFPEGMEIVDVPAGFEINSQAVTGEIGSISYKLNQQTNQLEAEAFEFSITLKAKTKGDFKLSEDSNKKNISYIVYQDIDGRFGRKFFPEISVSVHEKKLLSAPILSADPIVPTNGVVTVDIAYPKEASVKKYKIDDGDWNDYTEEIILEKNATVYARYFDVENNESEIGSLSVNNIIKKLRVLEVQPGTRYVLNNSYFDSSYQVELVQMPMSGFISQIEDINGKYDIVYVGNNVYSDYVSNHHYNINRIDNKYYKTIKYTSMGEKPNRIDRKPMKLPQGGRNGSDSLEYYSPNDMTDRRAKVLKSFIESGQLTIFSEDIFNYNLKDTKLYKNFVKYKDNSKYPHFKTVSRVSGDFIAKAYSNANKRPLLKVDTMPLEYTTKREYQNDTMMSYKFSIDSRNGNELMKARLYIDIDGDGIYNENEVLSQTDEITSGSNYSINYRVPDSFTGLQPWKLEIEEITSGTKNYRIGYTAFKANPLHVRVLQIYPDGSTFRLESEMLDRLEQDGVYKIDITHMASSAFNNNTPVLNGNYDMIVIGIADEYGGNDINSYQAIQSLKDFIASGQGVMFTHDTMTFRMKSINDWAYNLTKEFRDLIGLNIYEKDAFNPEEEPAHGNRLPLPSENKKSYGFTRFTLDRANNGDEFETSNLAFKLNEGLVTNYPYVLDENLSVSDTHYQYLQLDLEDESVIPWYTLQGGSYNKWNGRNDYYTYTKDNITYCGTGHQNDIGLDEHKFFINAMIKAIRGANHAPVLEVYDIDDGNNIPKSKDTLGFGFKIIDMDLDDQLLNADIYLDKNGDSLFSQDEKLVSFTGENGVENGVKTFAEIPIDVDENLDRLKIKIVAYDSNGAMTSREIGLNYVTTPTLSMSNNLSLGYLTGDLVDLDINIKAENIDFDTKVENINLNLEIDESIFDVSYYEQWIKTGNSYSSTIDDLSINEGAPSWTDTSKQISLITQKAGEFNIPSRLEYLISDNLIEEVYNVVDNTLSVSVKSGEIDVEVTDKQGSAIEGVEVKIKRGSTEYSGTTSATGLYSETGLRSGTYEVTIYPPEDYVLEATDEDPHPETKIFNLSYSNHNESISFKLSGDCIQDVDIITENNPVNVVENGKLIYKLRFRLTRSVEELSLTFSSYQMSDFLMEAQKLERIGIDDNENLSINDLTISDKTINFPPGLRDGIYECTIQMKINDDSLNPGDYAELSIDSAIIREPYFKEDAVDKYTFDPKPTIQINIVKFPDIL